MTRLLSLSALSIMIASRAGFAAPTPTPTTKTVALDTIEVPHETSKGGKVLPAKPWHAQLTLPAAAVVSMQDESSKYEADATVHPHVETDLWELDVTHDTKPFADEMKGYTSSGFKILAHDDRADGTVLVVGSKDTILEVMVTKKALDLTCHAFLIQHTAAARDSAIATCQTLASVAAH